MQVKAEKGECGCTPEFSIFIAKFVSINIRDIITIQPDIQFGTPVFTGTRVPVVTYSCIWKKALVLMNSLQIFPLLKGNNAIWLLI